MSYHDHDAERAVLGGILVDQRHMATAEELLRPEHFSLAEHRKAFAAMVTLSAQNEPLDLVTLRRESGLPAAFVAGLVDGLPAVTSIASWADVVRDKAKRRAARVLSEKLVSALDAGEDTGLVLDRHSTAIERLLVASDGADLSMAAALKLARERLERYAAGSGVTGIPSGVGDLDKLLCGFQPGTLAVIAARPAVGKSALGGQIAIEAARAGKRGLVFSMEMSPQAMAERIWLSEANVERPAVRSRPEYAWDRLGRAFGRLADLPVIFDPREAPSVAQIRAKAKKVKTVSGLDFVLVDYLQRAAIDPAHGDNNWLGVGENAKGLQMLARALDVAVIATAQLNRVAEGKEPTLADLAQSGQIEREANVVVFLHPEPGADPNDDYPTVNLIVAKHREGACARWKVQFQKPYSRFVTLEPDPPVSSASMDAFQ